MHVEAAELAARHTHLTRDYRDVVTARGRFIADIAQRSRERELGLSRDDGLDL